MILMFFFNDNKVYVSLSRYQRISAHDLTRLSEPLPQFSKICCLAFAIVQIALPNLQGDWLWALTHLTSSRPVCWWRSLKFSSTGPVVTWTAFGSYKGHRLEGSEAILRQNKIIMPAAKVYVTTTIACLAEV